MIEQVHLVVLISHFVRQATGPSFDGVELMPLFVVSVFADVHLRALSYVARSTFEISCVEHDEALPLNFLNIVIPVPTSLHNFVGEEVLVVSVDCLLRSIIPAHIYHVLATLTFVCSVNLRRYRFREVVDILHVDPIAHFV